MPSLVLIGIDSASLDLILKWKDKLKFFKKMIEEGFYGYLHSTTPPLSPAAWTSIYTGKKPCKTKFYDWLKYVRCPCKESRVRLRSFFDLKEPTIWDIATVHGLRSAVINAPMTYPPAYINGAMISGIPAHLYSGYPITYPLELKKELDLLVDGYEVMPRLDIFRFFEYDLIKRLKNVVEKRGKVIEYMYEKEEWDFFMPVFFTLDTIQHYFWNYFDENHPLYRKDSLSDIIFYFYKKIDYILDKFSRKIGETNILVISDHGAGPLYGYFLVNRFLASAGFLKTKRTSILKMLSTLIFTMIEMEEMNFVYNVARMTRIPLVDKLIDKPLIRQIIERFSFFPLMELMSGDFLEDVEWSRTLAYALGAVGGIFLTRNIPLDKKEKVKELVKKALKNLKLPSGEKAKVEFFDSYEGDEAPDLYYSIEDFKYLPIVHLAGWNSRIWEKPMFFTGWHRPLGIFFAHGPMFKNNKDDKIPVFNIYDIAPTVLYALGLPILSDMDGKPIFKIFTDEAKRKLKARVASPSRYRIARRIYLAKTRIFLKESLKGDGKSSGMRVE
ncbi:MAG: hypothetical protein DRJ38_06605 [Thermoprotei archaeon]|nr:MAG: hypothetical protein DRJ38_06605 [Thermoprotei archaeon]